jgi:hypothetical protein
MGMYVGSCTKRGLASLVCMSWIRVYIVFCVSVAEGCHYGIILLILYFNQNRQKLKTRSRVPYTVALGIHHLRIVLIELKESS